MKNLFSFPVIKRSIKSSWLLVLISIISMAANYFIWVSEAGVDNDGMQLLKVFETGISGNGLIYAPILAIFFAIILVTNEVDRGTLTVTLSTPTTRLQILLSKMLVFIFSIVLVCIATGIVSSAAVLISDVNFVFDKWWNIIVLWTLYSFAIGSIAFFISCWFNKFKYSLAISALVLGAFFVFGLLAQNESTEFFKYLTLQTLVDLPAVIEGKTVAWQMIALPAIAVPFYIIGIIKFVKKDLPI